MDWKALEAVNSSFTSDIKPNTLRLNKKYTIHGFVERPDGPFGRAVKVLLEEGQMYLPRRFQEYFTNERIEDYNKNSKSTAFLIIKGYVNVKGNQCPDLRIERYNEGEKEEIEVDLEELLRLEEVKLEDAT